MACRVGREKPHGWQAREAHLNQPFEGPEMDCVRCQTLMNLHQISLSDARFSGGNRGPSDRARCRPRRMRPNRWFCAWSYDAPPCLGKLRKWEGGGQAQTRFFTTLAKLFRYVTRLGGPGRPPPAARSRTLWHLVTLRAPPSGPVSTAHTMPRGPAHHSIFGNCRGKTPGRGGLMICPADDLPRLGVEQTSGDTAKRGRLGVREPCGHTSPTQCG